MKGGHGPISKHIGIPSTTHTKQSAITDDFSTPICLLGISQYIIAMHCMIFHCKVLQALIKVTLFVINDYDVFSNQI